MEARHVPFEYSHRWIKCSLKISEKHYSLFLACGLLQLFACVAVSFVPVVGAMASAIMMFIYGLGGMRLVKHIRETNSGTFDDYLKYTFDPIVFQRFVPFLVALTLLNGTVGVLGIVKLPAIILPVSLVANIALVFCIHSSYMMIQNPALNWQDALAAVGRGIWKNILTWIVFGLLLVLFSVGSILMCGVGLLLYFVPMTFPVNYLVYSSIYEGLDIDQLIKTSSKINAVHTVDAPPDEV